MVFKREISLAGLGEDHGRVIKAFSQSKEPTRAKIGVLLVYLREHRNRADYDDQFGNLDLNAQLALGRANSIFKLLKQLP